jgi:predicted GNAT family acetyltransferase
LDELNNIHEQLSRTTVALVASRRQEAKDLALDLAKAQAQLKEANANVERSQQALLDQQAAVATKDVFIAELQSLIAASSQLA